MEKPHFWVLWSLACEATQHSVRDPVLGERGARGFSEILDRYGIKGTFLVIAGDIESRPSLYRELHGEGHELGIHVHPADEGYHEFAGVMGPDEQRGMFIEANDRWAQVMGFEPETLAIGYGSANDYTYQALEEAGFDHGNISLVGRRLPECACVWEGAPLNIHSANGYTRLFHGER
ncbi:MAG: polysaccharide deacetylase family protein, partial [Candidatus Latescibacteria bacterium]|nr:polysaccharide deacetylase family protein [Candidatus Latescibacterota bacterium]